MLVVGLIIGGLFLTPKEFKEMGKSAFFGSAFFENFKWARGADYFDLSIARNAYMHLWSLGVEEQFYLVFPAIVFVASIFDCWTQTGKQDGNVLLIGNSHTEHLKSVFASFAPNFARVDIYAAGGTRPLEDVVQRFTEKQLIRDGKAHAVLDAVHRSPSKLVVISNTWGNINPDEEVLLKDGSKSTFEAVFKQTMLNIINSGKKIAFMIDNPTMPNEMENCMGIRPINLTKGECGIARKAYDNQSASQREYFTKWALAYPDQIFVIESGAALCNDEYCSMLGKSKEPLYTDTGHLTDAGAKLVSERAWLSITPILKDILEKP